MVDIWREICSPWNTFVERVCPVFSVLWKIIFGGGPAEGAGRMREGARNGGSEGEEFIQHFNVGLRTALNQSDYVSQPLFCF